MLNLRKCALALASVAVLAVPGIAVAEGMVGISMPTKTSARWIADGDNMVKQFQEAGYQTDLQYADDDIPNQLAQIENMITKGVNVLVIAAVDCAALTDACEKAKDAGIYVIADDRLITNTKAVDFYVTFDLVRMGELQGQYIVDKLDLENQAGIVRHFGGDTLNTAVYLARANPQVSVHYVSALGTEDRMNPGCEQRRLHRALTRT